MFSIQRTVHCKYCITSNMIISVPQNNLLLLLFSFSVNLGNKHSSDVLHIFCLGVVIFLFR